MADTGQGQLAQKQVISDCLGAKTITRNFAPAVSEIHDRPLNQVLIPRPFLRPTPLLFLLEC